jgi:hypothetical protein
MADHGHASARPRHGGPAECGDGPLWPITERGGRALMRLTGVQCRGDFTWASPGRCLVAHRPRPSRLAALMHGGVDVGDEDQAIAIQRLLGPQVLVATGGCAGFCRTGRASCGGPGVRTAAGGSANRRSRRRRRCACEAGISRVAPAGAATIAVANASKPTTRRADAKCRVMVVITAARTRRCPLTVRCAIPLADPGHHRIRWPTAGTDEGAKLVN